MIQARTNLSLKQNTKISFLLITIKFLESQLKIMVGKVLLFIKHQKNQQFDILLLYIIFPYQW